MNYDLVLGELYPSVYLSKVVTNIKTRFFCFFSYEGYTAFGFFNVLPMDAKFGFDKPTKEFNEIPDSNNLSKYIENAENIKEDSKRELAKLRELEKSKNL